MKPKNEFDKNEFSQSHDDEKDDKFLDEIDSVIDETHKKLSDTDSGFEFSTTFDILKENEVPSGLHDEEAIQAIYRHTYCKFLESMFLLGEDILKDLKFAIKGSAVTEEIVQAEISRFKALADGIYSAFLMRALLDWQSRGSEKFNQLDEFMISKIQLMKEHVDDRLAMFRIASVYSTAYRELLSDISYINDYNFSTKTKLADTTFRKWLFEHVNHPYPSHAEKEQMALETNVSIGQVNTWFCNARRRILRRIMPSVDWDGDGKLEYDEDAEGDFDPMNLSGSLFNMKRMNFMDALRHSITDPNNYTRKMTFKNDFSSNFNSNRKVYEEEFQKTHVLGMDIHLKTYKELLKSDHTKNLLKEEEKQLEEELNAGLEKVKLKKESMTKTEPQSPQPGPSMSNSNDSPEDSSLRLVDTPPHSNPVSPVSSGSATNFGINGYLVGPPMQVKITKKFNQGGRN